MKKSQKFSAVTCVLGTFTALTGFQQHAMAQVELGTAEDFAVLAGSEVTNTGSTVINGGHVGVSPGSAITGFPPGIVVPPFIIHAMNAVSLQAQNDLATAYNALAGMACNTDLTGQNLGGLMLAPGVYCFSSSAQLTGTLTLNAMGDPDAQFVFQIGSTLTTASNSSVLLIGDAQACNVFWQVGSSATLGTDTSFVGNILALASITLTTRVELSGRALARTGAVTMGTNTISVDTCVACQFDTDCPSTAPFCDSVTDLCVPCLADGDCDDGLFCNGSETCVSAACRAGSDPCLPLACDEVTNSCVNCVLDTDCPPSAPVCDVGQCVLCLVNGDCDDGNACTTDVCNLLTDSCDFSCMDVMGPIGGCGDLDITISCSELVPAYVPPFMDNCDTMLTIDFEITETIGDCPQERTIQQSVTATDICGNSTTCTRMIHVVDEEAPDATCPPAEVTLECDQPFPGFSPTFTDNCDTDLVPTGDCFVVQSKECPQERDFVCGLVVEDDCGNISGCSTTFHFVDTTPPVVFCEAEINVRCLSELGVSVEQVFIPEGFAIDNCDTEVLVFDDRPMSGLFPVSCDGLGTLITYTATDDCGNVATCVTHVRVGGGLCCPEVTDTDLKLMVGDLDLRQDTNGPVTTKARFDVWNSNEVRFSGTERCITCWDETLISNYGPLANHLVLENLQTDKGKARIQNEGSTVCPNSSESPLLGVAIREYQFLGDPSVSMRSAVTLVGMGEQPARIQYDIIGEPEEAADSGLILGPTVVPRGLSVSPLGPSINHGGNSSAGGVADNRASTTFKGSLIFWPVIEVKWDANGTLIQDTFIQLLNDNPGEVKVQLYQVNGDGPLDPVIDQNTMEIIERGHPGWNWSDFQITLTGDESAYWSVASGLPKGVSPISVLDPGNPNGRPDLDPSNPGGRVIRGFLVGWAVNDDGHEIRWNHLKGHVRYNPKLWIAF